MLRAPAVSRPAWVTALSGGGVRRSPVEVVATAASYLTRTQAADRSGLRAGPLGRWTDGVTALRGDFKLPFADPAGRRGERHRII